MNTSSTALLPPPSSSCSLNLHAPFTRTQIRHRTHICSISSESVGMGGARQQPVRGCRDLATANFFPFSAVFKSYGIDRRYSYILPCPSHTRSHACTHDAIQSLSCRSCPVSATAVAKRLLSQSPSRSRAPGTAPRSAQGAKGTGGLRCHAFWRLLEAGSLSSGRPARRRCRLGARRLRALIRCRLASFPQVRTIRRPPWLPLPAAAKAPAAEPMRTARQ